jgi:glucan 1,4-alpha-glucosidase
VKIIISLSVVLILLFGCRKQPENISVSSPNKELKVDLSLGASGEIQYKVAFHGKTLIDTSGLGFRLDNNISLLTDFSLDTFYYRSFSEVWHPKLGAFKNVKNEYNEVVAKYNSKSHKGFAIQVFFRVFDEGVAFRMQVSNGTSTDSVNVLSENTHFNITGNPMAWWNEAHYDGYEIMYNTTRLTEAKDLIKNKQTKSEVAGELYMKNFGGTIAFNTPFTTMSDDSTYMAFHEADLTNYAEMTLAMDEKKPSNLSSELVPWPDGIKVKTKLPFVTPWRTIHITRNPGDFIISQMEENLNAPSVLKDESYITPVKYMGVWWGYHIGKFTWDPRGARGLADGKDQGLNKKEHGASTANCNKYIDFASENKIPFLLIEGWNPTNYKIDSSDNFLRSHPDFDLNEVVAYGKKKNVEIIIHNETMGQILNFEKQADAAFARYKSLGIRAMKIGFAWHLETKNFDRAWGTDSVSLASYTGGKYYQHSQWAIQHYQKILELAAKYHQMVILHEYVKETGKRRTYPNMMSLEGVRGNEYNAWDKGHGNPPEHVTIIPFTRQLAGPIDYTPGILDVLFDKYKKEQRVNSTLANQLALYVVFYSPIVMAADLPENYEGHPAFKFIQDVPTDWDTTIVLNASIGNYTTVARKQGSAWYIGSVTDENKRDLAVNLDFLDAGKTYQMIQYADASDADWKTNPVAYEIKKSEVKKGDAIILNLAAGGGQAIQILLKN